MAGLILLILAQGTPAPERPVEERIEAFLKGDDGARAELVKLGAYAIRPLQAAREKGPEKIDGLVLQLKKVSAYPKDSAFPESLIGRGIITIRDQELDSIIPTLQSQGFPILWDQFDRAALKTSKVSFEKVSKTRDILDQICRQTGLDYGFFHNAVVLGMPDRLWPSGPLTKPPPLKGDDLAKAKALVEKLGDDSIEVRESATKDLLAFGPSVIALLEVHLNRKEGELTARCAALIEKLAPRPRGVFGPSGAERQKRTESEEKLLKNLQTMKVSLSFEKAPLSEVVGYVGAFSGIPIELRGDGGRPSVTIQCRNQNLIDLLCLITQARDLDFILRDQMLIIDTREGIEKQISGEK